MATKVLTPLDMDRNEIRFQKLHVLANAPSGQEGQIFYSSTTKSVFFHDGTNWNEITGSGIATSIQNLDSTPSSPSPGDIFFNTVTNSILYWDGTQWQDVATDQEVGNYVPLNNITHITDNYNVLDTDRIVVVDASSPTPGPSLSVNLPEASSVIGMELLVKRTDSTSGNYVAINATGVGDLIDGIVGGSIYLYHQNDYAMLKATAADEWKVLTTNGIYSGGGATGFVPLNDWIDVTADTYNILPSDRIIWADATSVSGSTQTINLPVAVTWPSMEIIVARKDGTAGKTVEIVPNGPAGDKIWDITGNAQLTRSADFMMLKSNGVNGWIPIASSLSGAGSGYVPYENADADVNIPRLFHVKAGEIKGQPVVVTAEGVGSVTSSAFGTLPSGTYYFRGVPVDRDGNLVAPQSEKFITIDGFSTKGINVALPTTPGAVEWRIYEDQLAFPGTPNFQHYRSLPGSQTSWLYNNPSQPWIAGTPPTESTGFSSFKFFGIDNTSWFSTDIVYDKQVRVNGASGDETRNLFVSEPSAQGTIIGSYGELDGVTVDANGDFVDWDGEAYINGWSTGAVYLAFGGGDTYVGAGGGDVYTCDSGGTTYLGYGDGIVSFGSSGSYDVDPSTGDITMGQYNVNALNTAPSFAGDAGTTGEIRFTSSFIYVCVATNTWVRASLASW